MSSDVQNIIELLDFALSLTHAGSALNASPTFEGAIWTAARLVPTVVPDLALQDTDTGLCVPQGRDSSTERARR